MKLIIISLILPILVCGCSIFDPFNYDKQIGVPEGTMEKRDAWGKKHLGITYKQSVAWINQAEIIKEIVGDIITVAPIGKPNYVTSSFSDGMYGTHNIEVIGDKKRAVFSVEGIAPCNSVEKGNVCFNDAYLSTQYSRITVHYSGVRLDKFNRLNNKDKILDLTKEIDNFNSEEQTQDIEKYELLIKRYRLYSSNNNFDNAILDLEAAIDYLTKFLAGKMTEANSKEKRSINRKIELCKYWMAQLYYKSEQFDKSATVIQNILDSSSNPEQLNTKNLWLWIARMRANQANRADEELKKSLDIATKQEDFCYVYFAKFLLGELQKDLFINQNNKHAYENCSYIDDQKNPLTYYYIAQKEIIKGNTELGHQLLLKSLSYDDSLRESSLEYGFAVHELAQF